MNSEQASRPQRVAVKGSEIAFAATGIVTNDLERHRAGADKPGQSAYRFDDDFAEVRRRLVKSTADYRILSIHYGEEGKVRTDGKQIADWRGLAAEKDGIDLIVGHHAHVVRGSKWPATRSSSTASATSCIKAPPTLPGKASAATMA
jgi:poly-gamma-glutamate synthesis protein (capsule biosynthesis protein)